MQRLFAIAVAALLVVPAAEAQQQGRMIVNTLSGKCLDVSGAPGVNRGAPLILYDCERSGYNPNGTPSDQFWIFSGGFIRNALSGKCIDVSGAPGVVNGARLQLWDCETSGRSSNGALTDQLWALRPDGFIVNQNSGKCIDVSGAPGVGNGAPVQLWDCENSGRNPNGSVTDQRWRY